MIQQQVSEEKEGNDYHLFFCCSRNFGIFSGIHTESEKELSRLQHALMEGSEGRGWKHEVVFEQQPRGERKFSTGIRETECFFLSFY